MPAKSHNSYSITFFPFPLLRSPKNQYISRIMVTKPVYDKLRDRTAFPDMLQAGFKASLTIKHVSTQ
jgi:hypothetical protein